MATRARAVLNGRFSPGTVVRLIEVRDERTLRPGAGDREVDTKRVDENGRVEFSSGVKVDARYFIVGQQNGQPLEVRVRGRADGDDDTINEVAPVQYERTRLSDGSWLDEPPEQHQKPEGLEAAPHLGQHQVPRGQVQRSDTPRGSAHPFDPDETPPYGRQEDVGDGVVQSSSTATGRAAPVLVGPQRQEDVPKGTIQRSDTPTGVATPIHSGGPVAAQIEKESVAAKEARGEPGRAAAEPIEKARPVRGASPKQSAARQEEAVSDVREAVEAAQEAADDPPVPNLPEAAPKPAAKRAAKKRAAKGRSTTAKGKE